MDDVLGVEEEFRDKFREVVAYYKRFWLEEIGPDMICQCDEANRTNNHAEAFHRGIGCAVLVAHPQTLVLIQLLVNIEREAMLRFDAQRSGKDVQPRDKRLDDLETSLAKTMTSYGDGLFRNDVEYLSAIAKLYVEYNHKIKAARILNSTNVLNRVVKVRDAVVKALDDQNLVIFGQDETRTEERSEDDAFVDADFNTEIIFDSNGQDHENDQSGTLVVEHSACPVSVIPMDVCPEEHISQPSRDEKKPQAEADSFRKQAKRRKKRTLLQRMKKKR